MKKLVRVLAACAIALSAQSAWATPSTHRSGRRRRPTSSRSSCRTSACDTYFNDKADYPIDIGLTIGVLPFEKVQAEVGLRLLLPLLGFEPLLRSRPPARSS